MKYRFCRQASVMVWAAAVPLKHVGWMLEVRTRAWWVPSPTPRSVNTNPQSFSLHRSDPASFHLQRIAPARCDVLWEAMAAVSIAVCCEDPFRRHVSMAERWKHTQLTVFAVASVKNSLKNQGIGIWTHG